MTFASPDRKRPRAESELFARLPAPAEIRRLVDRERGRADRTGCPLSVVAFMPRSAEALAQLVGFLRERLRNTDEVGWLDGDRVCAVLPDTPLAGAYKVAEEALVAVAPNFGAVSCTVYTYPEGPAGLGNSPARADAAALEELLAPPVPRLKRAFDLVVASLALLLLGPLLLLIAAAVKLTSRGPILFCQRRTGRGGKPFVMYKFRTMVADAEAKKAELLRQNEQDGPAFKLKHDPRVTRLGRLLRTTSLDELPQLFNVLKGEMAIVGPRPLPCAETDRCEGWQRRRLLATPGITCIWQVRGRCRVSFNEWMRMDVTYVRTWSLRQDVQLVLETVPAVLTGRGAS
jgi:lipopolysaccharide/colanic/teichoic acid biosynthesis glycosyltransferase